MIPHFRSSALGCIPGSFLLAATVSEAAQAAFEDGSMRAKVSPVTQELLKFWFDDPFTARTINFHKGQKQAILNAVYLHEVLGVRNVSEAYEKVATDLLGADGGSVLKEVSKPKYAYPKYLVKMATGTGKTWVMHALLIWQYLNARAEKGERSGRQTKWRLALQVNLAQVAAVVDNYIRFDLFGVAFDPFSGSDWKVLTCMNGIVTRHIVEQIGELVHEMEERTETQVAEVRKIPFSTVNKIIVRERSSLELVKTIHTREGYPAHGGGLEKACMGFFDDDAGVERFIKINEAKHVFARIPYLLLSESDFYSYKQAGATCKDIFAATEMTEHGMKGEFSFD